MDLRVTGGMAAGSSIPVEEELVIGRAERPPGNLGDDPLLSRQHARVRHAGGGLVIEDLGSANGTFVNGERLEAPRLLRPGDKIEMGDSTLELGGIETTKVHAAASPVTRASPVQAPPPAAPPPPPARAPQLDPAPAFGHQPAAQARAKKGFDPRIAVLGVLCVLLAAAAVIGFATGGDDDEATGAVSSGPGGEVAGWLYVVSNIGPGERNSVLAIDYREDGSITPVQVREFPTRGTGGQLMPGESFGRLAADAAVSISPDKRFLFAVNQGSDTVAVFRIDRATGSLEHVEGSPFSSGGRAPIATGFNGRHLVIANKGILPGEELPGDAQQTNYASFEVSDNGALKPVNSVPAPGSGPTAAVFAPNNRIVFGAEFFGATLNSFTISEEGTLALAPGSPAKFPDSMVRGLQPPPGQPPDMLKVPYGIAVHPTEPFVYYVGATSNRVATYRYDENNGQLTFVGQVGNPDTIAGCWALITSDARFLYVGNSGSENVTAYRVSEDGAKLTRIELQQNPSGGKAANLAFNADETHLYSLATSDSPDFPLGPRAAPANTVDVFSIADNGSIDPTGSIVLPVTRTSLPIGLAALEREG